ncbi:hypothetical protein J4G08_11280 [Candidatus Poribacteria bacterium]|nr:hypothetical protein [Candidatus Poribacteria bacterium]
MVTREWLVETETPHTVRVDHWSTWSGKIHIYVDDELIFERRSKLSDTGVEHRFKVDGLPYIIRILYRTWHYEYELWVDGKLQ